MGSLRRAAASLALLLLAAACREGEENPGFSGTVPIPPPVFGTDGCRPTTLALAPGAVPEELALAVLQIGPASQIAAAGDGELLYATGADGAVVAIDLTGPVPVETELVSGPELDALLLAAGVSAFAAPSGVAVLDPSTLVVAESASNALLLLPRDPASTEPPSFLAGLPSAAPGFADGLAHLARFSLGEPSEIAPAGDGSVWLTDPGNHAVRVLAPGAGGGLFVTTVAGTGAPGFADGDLDEAFLDTPSGLTIGCDDRLLVTELGAAGAGGHRLRALTVGVPSFFGGSTGTVETLAGSGTSATTAGVGAAAGLARPSGAVATEDGLVYWIDADTGVLRRLDLATGLADCPLAADCAAAVLAPLTTPGAPAALALGASGALYVLDTGGGRLLRFAP